LAKSFPEGTSPRDAYIIRSKKKKKRGKGRGKMGLPARA
jgi:hypothetical protein